MVHHIPEKERMDVKAGALLTVLCMVWGLNVVAIKISNTGIAPMFGAGLRSLIATICLVVWMYKNIPLFGGKIWDGMAVGLLFGLEFLFLYPSLVYTSAASAWILLYSAPFFNAIGAHFFLKGDRLNWNKGIGLIVAFVGIVVLLSRDIELPSPAQIFGDILALFGGFFWAVTTIYIKRRLVGSVTHYHTLFYQAIFSIPVLMIGSFVFRETPIHFLSTSIVLSMIFQGVIVAFISYLLWFILVHGYPASLLSSFTFLTPIFAALAGIVFLSEPITVKVGISLVLVSVGIYIVNRK